MVINHHKVEQGVIKSFSRFDSQEVRTVLQVLLIIGHDVAGTIRSVAFKEIVDRTGREVIFCSFRDIQNI